MEKVNVLWYRNGLRLHDNGSLHNATKNTEAKLFPVFIFDGVTPITKKCQYNKAKFLLECLEDLDKQFKEVGAQLYCIQGDAEDVFRQMSKKVKIERICFDQDCEPIWLERDNAVKNFCVSHKIEAIENIGATLWDPLEIIEANGGTPPLTYSQFCHVTNGIGQPPRPLPTLDLNTLNFYKDAEELQGLLKFFPSVPSPEDIGFKKDGEEKIYMGGETTALKFFNKRVQYEKEAFLDGSFLPNRRDPDILSPPKSLSPDLKFGCISVRTFYWAIIDAFEQVNEGNPPASYTIVSQLIWREFFYAMSANNPFYGEMERNPICINVPWYQDDQQLESFLLGKTGYPFIDAGVRQLRKEGWIHHIVRNALSMFLTRGDLWLNWEHGEVFFRTYLIDGDWAVNAGNWMWVSSSAFEKALNCSFSLDPRVYGRKFDPYGVYIKKYIPELKNMPVEYLYAPWTAPEEVQKEAGCIVGQDYPEPMVDHDKVSARNTKIMQDLQDSLMSMFKTQPIHVKPSNDAEIKNYFRTTFDTD